MFRVWNTLKHDWFYIFETVQSDRFLSKAEKSIASHASSKIPQEKFVEF